MVHKGLPEVGRDRFPGYVAERLRAYENTTKFEMVAFLLDFILDVIFELDQKGVSRLFQKGFYIRCTLFKNGKAY